MRGQRCREYAIMMMTVIGMVGRGAVQGDAIREARAVNDDWKLVSSASLYRALIGNHSPLANCCGEIYG